AASVPFRLYIDGKQVASTGSTDNLSTLDSDNLTIGSDYTLSGENRFFDGKIDEVRIYDRELSQAEIQALYSTADPNPLVFESSTPTNNSSGIAITDNITVRFNKPLDPSTLHRFNLELRRSDNLSFFGEVYPVASDNQSLIFDPDVNLNSMDNYTLLIKSGIRDYLGNALTPAQIQFQTQLLGDGSVSSPYLINSEAGLQKMHDNLTGHYLLTNNIALTQHWNPLGWDNTTPTPFSGSFDGDHHTISNLTIDNSSSNNIGFFSSLSGNVTEIKFQNILVKGLGDTGVLAGKQDNTSSVSQLVLENMTVVGNDNRTGGLIGFAEGIISEVGIKNLDLSGQGLV
ncbi:MAG: LamG-like jellyroll fold domain-containing protein, partial [bacterium]